MTTVTLDDINLLAGTWGRGVPHDQFDRLRKEAPVYWHPEPADTGFWALTKYDDVKRCSHDWRTFSSERGATFIPTQDEMALESLRLTILNMDPPKHERYRRLVSKGFTPSMIRVLVEDIERRAVRVIDDVCEKGEVEFVEEIAAQVPVQMICEMIGLEKELWPRMFELSNQLIGSRYDPDYQELPGGPQKPGSSRSRFATLRACHGSERKKISGLPCGSPDNQTYLRVPSIPSVAWQPYPSPLGRLRAHSFASPPHDGFAFIEDGRLVTALESAGCRTQPPVTF